MTMSESGVLRFASDARCRLTRTQGSIALACMQRSDPVLRRKSATGRLVEATQNQPVAPPCRCGHDLLVSLSDRVALLTAPPAGGGRAGIARACPPVPTSPL